MTITQVTGLLIQILNSLRYETKATSTAHKFSVIASFNTRHVEGTLLPVGGVHLGIVRSARGNGGFRSQSLHRPDE